MSDFQHDMKTLSLKQMYQRYSHLDYFCIEVRKSKASGGEQLLYENVPDEKEGYATALNEILVVLLSERRNEFLVKVRELISREFRKGGK